MWVSLSSALTLQYFVELRHNGLVVRSYEYRVDGMLDDVGDGAELSAVGASSVGDERLGSVGGGAIRNKNAPARASQEGWRGRTVEPSVKT